MSYKVRQDLLVQAGLNRVHPNPFQQFKQWFQAAQRTKSVLQPDAMTLSTLHPNGFPDARIVLLKDFRPDGFSFFTNWESTKGKSLESYPKASLTFFWESLHRQIRIQGTLTPVSKQEADTYFKSRPRQSQLGAWASDQSRPLKDRPTLLKRYHELVKHFDGTKNIPRPSYWGGYRLKPTHFEFWQAGAYRLHDRFEYAKKGSRWISQRLYP